MSEAGRPARKRLQSSWQTDLTGVLQGEPTGGCGRSDVGQAGQLVVKDHPEVLSCLRGKHSSVNRDGEVSERAVFMSKLGRVQADKRATHTLKSQWLKQYPCVTVEHTRFRQVKYGPQH